MGGAALQRLCECLQKPGRPATGSPAHEDAARSLRDSSSAHVMAKDTARWAGLGPSEA